MSSASHDARNAADQSAPNTPENTNTSGERRVWTEPVLLELPKLSELTLQSGIPGGGGTGGGGSGVIP